MGHLWDGLSHAYEVLGFDAAADADEVFRCLVPARIIEPTSKFDSLRVLAEAGIDAPSYPTMNRRLPVFATDQWRERLAALCAAQAGVGPASLVLYDVSTLYFETEPVTGPRTGLLERAAVGAADHRRAAHPEGVHGRPPSDRRDRGGRCGDDLKGQPA